MRRGPKPETTYPLTKDEIKIGRGSKNEIVIHDNEVSREHAILRHTENGYEIEDLGSSNGTYVNGQQVDGIWLLSSRCIIELGDMITFEYHTGEPNDETSEVRVNEINLEESTSHYLIVKVHSQKEPSVYPLLESSLTVGRGVANDVVIVEPEMSRQHFRLTAVGRGYKIEDMGSTNGTMVNGEVLSDERILSPNDVIQIGMMVQILYSNNADQAVSNMTTTNLKDTDEVPATFSSSATSAKTERAKRKTSPEQVPSISLQNANHTTVLGTGVENVDLKNQLLITYARDDWESTVAPLVNTLHDNDINAWVEQYLINGSSDWRVATEQARLECWGLLVVVTRNSVATDAVKKNWRHFINREKPIILLVRDLIDTLPLGSDKATQIDFNPALPSVAYKQIITEILRLQP